MPAITVSMRVGRTTTQKDAFVKDVTEAAVKHLGVQANQVIIEYDEKAEDAFYRAGKHL